MKRLPQILLIVTFIGFSWLGMQVVHEAGHVVVALLTGGEVAKVALHPLIMSRTDLGENPHPLAVVWGGPLIGSALPLLLFALGAALGAPGVYLFRFFAGFCLIANGVYIGVGRFLAEGADPWVMTENGSLRWLLIGFGIITFPLGFYLLNRQGPNFRGLVSKRNVNPRATCVHTWLLLTI